jgi:hypothetical protein
MSDEAKGVDLVIIEIRLRNGDTIKARADGSEGMDTAGIHRMLQDSEFVRVGDDTIVRSADVQSIQAEHHDSGGLIDSLISRVGGGSDESSDDDSERHAAPQRGLDRVRRYEDAPIETKPFFLTSEFVLAFLAWLALLLTSLATDSVDAWAFSLLTVAIAAGYMVSRGFAKANTPSPAWDPRESWQPKR